MPTIANLPGADVNVQFPSGAVKTVNMIVLLAQTQHAESMSKFGCSIARNAPTLADLREQYEMPAFVRTWDCMAANLRRFHADLKNR